MTIKIIFAAGFVTFVAFFLCGILIRGLGMDLSWREVLRQSYVAQMAGMMGAAFFKDQVK